MPGGFRGLGRTRRGPMPRRRLGGGEEMRVTPARLLQQCCQAARQRRTRADRSGTSAQRRDHNGRSWMMCSLLWSKGSSPCTQLRAPVPRSRAISVPLPGVSSGTSRLLTGDCPARSARPQQADTSLCKQVITTGEVTAGKVYELTEWRSRSMKRPGTSCGTCRRYRGYFSGKVATIRCSSMRILTSNRIRPTGKSTIH